MFLSLRVRLTLIFIGFTLGPIVILGLVISQRAFMQFEEQSTEYQRIIAEKVGGQIQSFLYSKAEELELLNQVLGLGTMDLRSQRQVLANTVMSSHDYQKITIINTVGKEVFGVSRSNAITKADLEDRSEDDVFLAALSSEEIHFSSVFFDQDMREPLIAISIPLLDKRTGGVFSVLSAELRFKSVWDLLRAHRMGEQQEIFVTDTHGLVVAHTNPSVAFGNTTINLPQSNGRAVGLNGTESFLAMHEVELADNSIFVIAEQSVSSALRLANHLLQVIIIITTSMFAAALTLIHVIVGRAVGPIKTLVQAASTIAGGDYSKQVPIPRAKNEMGELAYAFNTMINALHQRDQSMKEQQLALQHAHDELERRVAERTADLADTNEQLRGEAKERQRAERALRDERDKAQLYFDVAGSMLMVLDRDGVVTLINGKGKEILGIEDERVVGQNWFDSFIPDDTRDEIKDVFRQLMTSDADRLGYYENTIVSVSGEEKLIGWHNTILYDGSGKINGILSSGEDLTQRRRLETEQQKVQKLESVGVLAGGIAHDSNNILTAALGSISLARLEMSQGDNNADTSLTTAEKACWQLKGLNQQLLIFAKGGAPVKKLASLETIIRESCGLTLRGSNIIGKFEISDDLWLAEVDRNQLSQVLNNLTINAVQAMPMGGEIQVSAQNRILRSDQYEPLPPGRYVQIMVRDHGIGIPADHLKRIFDPYFTTKGQGSGLGLAIVYSVVKGHGGYVTAQSDPLEGTVFTLLLPASRERNEDAQVQGVSPEQGTGTVLVMDDQKEVRDVLCRMIERLGYTVRSAAEGATAIEIYSDAMNSAHPIDALILDLTVPGGMGGAETIERLLKIDPEVRVIVSSGYSNDQILASFSDYGFKGIITKPYDVNELSSALKLLIP